MQKIRLNQNDFDLLIVGLVAAVEKFSRLNASKEDPTDINVSRIGELIAAFKDARNYARAAVDNRSRAIWQISLSGQPAPPPDPAVSSKSESAQRFRYASKSDGRKLARVTDRLREITARDGTGRQFDGAYDYTVRAVIEALELGDLFYEFPVNRSDP